MTWRDYRLKWDYKDYGGLELTHFGDAELWKPDIYVYNNFKVKYYHNDVSMIS
ncbi:Acetylcholine receptor subunit gamma, partial [Armadillidium nasatum]